MVKRNKGKTRTEYWAVYRRKILKTHGNVIVEELQPTTTKPLKPSSNVIGADALLAQFDRNYKNNGVSEDESNQEEAINRTISRIFVSIAFFLVVVFVIGLVLIIRRYT